jgi:hypothetical protein
MTWGVEDEVTERFTSAGAQPENVSFERDTYRFEFPAPPAELVSVFRDCYGPTMNAFEAAEGNGKSTELEDELVTLFEAQNESPDPSTSSIPATFLRVTVLL